MFKRASGTNILCQRKKKIDVVAFKILDSGMVGESVNLGLLEANLNYFPLFKKN